MRIPDFAAQDASRRFSSELYKEHLEEASFLYERRVGLYDDPAVGWLDIAGFEERLEAHIEALVFGEEHAIETCRRQIEEGDAGELYAVMCVFCLQRRCDALVASLEQFDPADVERASAVADALKYELPESWFQDFVTLLRSSDPKLAPILARAFGYRRVASGPELLKTMNRCPAAALPEVVWALGRIPYEPAADLLLENLRSEDVPVRLASAIALARIGEPSVIDLCLDRISSDSWPILPLGLSAGRRVLGPLMELAQKNSRDAVVALGLLGDPVSVPLLISLVANENLAPKAALALECLTGAGLYETVFVPDEVEEDELFDSELEDWKQGKPFNRGDGRPFGSNVTRLSQDPEVWAKWWQENQDRFTPGMRYRNGGPCSPARLIATLAAERTPHEIRRYCCEELAIRYRDDFGLETDMPVLGQTARLSEAATALRADSTRFEEGAWYFAAHKT